MNCGDCKWWARYASSEYGTCVVYQADRAGAENRDRNCSYECASDPASESKPAPQPAPDPALRPDFDYCASCESAGQEKIVELEEKIRELEAENARLREFVGKERKPGK